MFEPQTDARLLERFATGREEAAFAELVGRHAGLVRAACRRVLPNEHDAEDVVQATFLTLALNAGARPWRDSVAGWLRVVARRLALHSRAVSARRRRHEVPASVWDAWDLSERSGTPIETVEREEVVRLVRKELGGLPEKYRTAVVLCDLEGLSHEEAAARMGLPRGSMSRRLGKARSILKRRLSATALPMGALLLVAASLWLSLGTRRAESPAVDPFRLADRRSELPRGAFGPSRADLALRTVADYADHPKGLPISNEVIELRLAALGLERAAAGPAGPSLLAAARRFDASCLRCHLTASP